MSASILSLNEAVLDIHGDALERDYARILKALNHLMTVRSYYSPGHEQYAEAARKACATIVESMGDRTLIPIEIGTEGMMLGGQTVEAGHREVRQLHDLLVPLNIAHLEIDRGLTPDDLRLALETLHDYKLKLGASTSFREITIEGMPETVRISGCKLFSGDTLSPVLDEGELSLEELAQRFLALVNEIVANMEHADRAGRGDPHTDGPHTGPGDLDGLSGGHLPADLQELTTALQELARLEYDPQNFLTLIQNARKALDISRDPGSVDLVFRMLRKELGKKAPVASTPPVSRLQAPGRQRENIALLRSRLAETITAATRAGDIDTTDTRGDFLGICFKILGAEPSPSLEVHLKAALKMTLEAADLSSGDVQRCARWVADGVPKQQVGAPRDLLREVTEHLRAHNLELLPTFWLTLWELLDETLHSSVWPYLVNDILLGMDQAPAAASRRLLEAVGAADSRTARSCRDLLLGMPAFGRNRASGVIFSMPPSRLHALHAVMLDSPLASWHAPRLQKLLMRTSPHSLAGIVTHLVGDLRGESSSMIAALLEESEPETLSDQLQDAVVQLLAEGLTRLPRRDRDQAWVAHGLEWLNRLDHEAAAPVLQHVLNDKRLLFFRAWPPKCRNAAERMVR